MLSHLLPCSSERAILSQGQSSPSRSGEREISSLGQSSRSRFEGFRRVVGGRVGGASIVGSDCHFANKEKNLIFHEKC